MYICEECEFEFSVGDADEDNRVLCSECGSVNVSEADEDEEDADEAEDEDDVYGEDTAADDRLFEEDAHAEG